MIQQICRHAQDDKLFTEKAEPHQVSFDQMPSEAHIARVKVKQTAQVSKPFLEFPEQVIVDMMNLQPTNNEPKRRKA